MPAVFSSGKKITYFFVPMYICIPYLEWVCSKAEVTKRQPCRGKREKRCEVEEGRCADYIWYINVVFWGYPLQLSFFLWRKGTSMHAYIFTFSVIFLGIQILCTSSSWLFLVRTVSWLSPSLSQLKLLSLHNLHSPKIFSKAQKRTQSIHLFKQN